MRCFLTCTIAAALALALGNTSWSQTGGAGAGAGGGGRGGGASASGAAGAGGAGAAGTAGVTAGNTAGTVGNAATPGNAGRPVANGNGNVGLPGSSTNPGNSNGVALPRGGNANARANRNARLNASNRANVNGRLSYQGNINRTPFFNDAGVRQQLRLNNNQYNSLNGAYQNAYTLYNQGITSLNGNSTLPAQQRALQQQQLATQFNQNFASSLNNDLYDPQMRARLNQLNHQYQGVYAFNDPTVQQQLNLSPAQVRQFQSLQSNWQQQMQQLSANGTTVDPAQWSQLQQQYATQINTALTPAQQQIWSQMTGETYLFSPNAYFNDTSGVNNTGVQNAATNGANSVPATGAGTTVPATGATQNTAPVDTVPASTAQGTQGSAVR